jgi:mannonate dehydratase
VTDRNFWCSPPPNLKQPDKQKISILDHAPALVGGANAQTAYGFAYTKALLNRANAEAKA